MSSQQITNIILRQTDDLHNILVEGGKDVADNMRRYLTQNKQNRIIWMHDGDAIVTMTAPQKAASQILVYTLAKQTSNLSDFVIFPSEWAKETIEFSKQNH